MAAGGVTALDPMGLARLEATLHGVAEVYRQRSWQVTQALAGTGESAAAELAELRRVEVWCEAQRDDIARRRRLLAALPVALPIPAWRFGSSREAVAEADAVALRLGRLLDGRASWDQLARATALVERGAHDEAFAARLLTALGPERAAGLPALIDQAARREAGGPEAADRAHRVVAEALLAASRHRGPEQLSEEWMTAFAGVDGDLGRGGGEAAPDVELSSHLEALGFGTGLARAVALGLGAGTLATVVARGGNVLAVARVVVGGEADGWSVAGGAVELAGSVGMVLVATGVVVAPLGVAALLGGSVVAGALGWFLRQVEPAPGESASPESRARRHSRTVNPDTGVAAFPGGGTDQPRQDGAGGVLAPNVVR